MLITGFSEGRMRPLTFLKMLLAATISLGGAQRAAADPEEHLNDSVKRDATTVAPYKVSFAKDIYYESSQQVPYTVQIPYQEDETTSTYDPVTTSQYSCDNPSDASTCGYKDVTEYQWVSHTVSVTKYREETQCCETQTYTQFDHVWKQDVVVNFPPETTLLAGEKEKVVFSLAGNEMAPAVHLESSGGIFHYKIVKTEVKADVLYVDLASVPFLTDKTVGASSIGTAALVFGPAGITFNFQDKMANPRIASTYKISVTEKASNVVLGETTSVSQVGVVASAQIAGLFDAEKDYDVTIGIGRSGFMLIKPVQFIVTRKIGAESLDRNEIRDASLVHHFALTGIGEDTKLVFHDDSPLYSTVHSQYDIKVSLIAKTGAVLLGEKSLDRQSLLRDAKKNYTVALKDVGITDDALKTLVKNVKLRFEMTIDRTSKRIGDVKLARKADLVVTK
jgi:hypothetical protein